MAKRTALDRLDGAISKILADYAEEIEENVGEIVDQVAATGAKALTQKSRETFPDGTGEYAKGWTVEKNGKKHRLLNEPSVIYNEHYSLPHLLEHGHVTRNGTGRTFDETPPHEHIAPVENDLAETFEREVLQKL